VPQKRELGTSTEVHIAHPRTPPLTCRRIVPPVSSMRIPISACFSLDMRIAKALDNQHCQDASRTIHFIGADSLRFWISCGSKFDISHDSTELTDDRGISPWTRMMLH